MARCVTAFDFRTWPTGAKENILFGEEEICELSKKFKLNERELIHSLMPEKLLHLKNTLHIIPVSSSECARGFFPNDTSLAALLTDTIKNIMFVRIVTSFKVCEETWLPQTPTANQERRMKKKMEEWLKF
ncbi:hypothetical protein PR048_022978 [Dryococelus australis]|uniref:Uncharacterized protein n=1 Tax=Dryococelus australis TaxID=614101 RepID=A0ABQ9GSR6_9NEOP|nr:hypothetical protein PR048_022978 [Dryococelus australis]